MVRPMPTVREGKRGRMIEVESQVVVAREFVVVSKMLAVLADSPAPMHWQRPVRS